MPGFVDAHNHASQYSYTGKGYDMNIHERREHYKIPTEAKFADVEAAKNIYPKAVVHCMCMCIHVCACTRIVYYYAREVLYTNSLDCVSITKSHKCYHECMSARIDACIYMYIQHHLWTCTLIHGISMYVQYIHVYTCTCTCCAMQAGSVHGKVFL